MSILGAFVVSGCILLVCLCVASAQSAPAPTVTVRGDPPRRRASDIDGEVMLAVIRDIESGNNPNKIGTRGERSAYQFMPAIWLFHTPVPFRVATLQPAVAHMIAQRHFLQLRKELSILRLPWAPEFIAAAWHHGSEHAGMHVMDDDAQRAATLYRAKVADETKVTDGTDGRASQ